MSLFRDLSADTRWQVGGGTVLYSTVGAGALAALRHRVPEGAGPARLVLEVAEVVLGQQAMKQRVNPPVVEAVHSVHLECVTVICF